MNQKIFDLSCDSLKFFCEQICENKEACTDIQKHECLNNCIKLITPMVKI
jgi:hypothetical protein